MSNIVKLVWRGLFGKGSFEKFVAAEPIGYRCLSYVGLIVDGFTGLIMIFFGRRGTQLNIVAVEQILLYQVDQIRKRRLEAEHKMRLRHEDMQRQMK